MVVDGDGHLSLGDVDVEVLVHLVGDFVENLIEGVVAAERVEEYQVVFDACCGTTLGCEKTSTYSTYLMFFDSLCCDLLSDMAVNLVF